MDDGDALSEKAAAESFARAWNRMDVEPLEVLLNEDTIYESQMVITPMVGKEDIISYLELKFRTLHSDPKYFPYFEIGYLNNMEPCVIMCQGSRDNPVGVAVFEVEGEWIKRIDICIVPSPYEAKRTGFYPG